jgi:hypothetical protein
MNHILESKYGCYIAEGMPFISKLDALNYVSQFNSNSIFFYYHNHIWENFDRSKLGTVPLADLYKERALQLRNKYDYLVLHYSGGSDSHNVLHTFIENNIKLDEIYVRWAKPLIDEKFYKPDKNNFSAENSPSEWNFTIRPALESIQRSHPEIKITISDFTKNFGSFDFSEKKIEKIIVDMNLTVGALGSIAQRIDRNVSITESKNKNIGHIFGVEKPLLYIEDNFINMLFQDSMMEVVTLQDLKSNDSAELFYWAPDFPLLTMEMAYQCSLYFKNYQEVIYKLNQDLNVESINREIRRDIYKKALYEKSWNLNKFQVNKPNFDRSDWWSWIHESTELDNLKQNFKFMMNEILGGVDKRMVNSSGDSLLMKPIVSKRFKVLKL